MTDTKILNPQTIVATEKTDKAKKILFSPVDAQVSKVAQSGLEKFSNSYQAQATENVIDMYDLRTYMREQNPNAINREAEEIDNTFKEIVENQVIKPVQTEQKVLSKPKIKSNSQVNAKLNFRGKLMISVFASICALFGFLSIFNAIDIKNINNEIQSLTTEVSQSESHLGELWQIYSGLNNSNRITTIVGEQGMSEISKENKIETELNIAQKKEPTKSTNWFDKFCDFLMGIFK